MTSEERREARFQRRKARRAERKAANCAPNDCFDWVFSYDHLYHSYKMCRRGVAWKASVQKYITQAPLNVYQTEVKLQTGKFRTTGFTEFDLCERGKVRHIRSVGINERVVQRCLCDYALVPMLGRTYIYDNGASTERKGYTFAIRRLCQHLREHYRKHGADGYVLLFDFSKFFDRVSHQLVKAITRKEFTDERIIKITDHFVDAFGDIGLGLGSQVSQVFALASANRLDHYIKEVCRIRGYGRYMDDGYLIHPSKEYLQSCLLHIQAICDELEIKLNTKKTQIVKLTHGFTYLKVRFFLLESGKIIRKIYRRSVTKMRQKLKAFRRLVDEWIMTYDDVYQSYQSWKAYAMNFNAYRTIQSMNALYNRLFIALPPPTEAVTA
ncbi:MAG: RNA-directed DNA polymerase [Oscillospiraceae bacterium]|nr:RNA-directed DNA polymerase [Oscillospiraceae bacterium]